MLSILSATVTILPDRNATAVSVSIEVCDRNGEPSLIEATGSSKREQGDIYNADIARDLAVGRAFEKLGRKLKSRGKRAVDLATANRQPK